MLGTSRRKGSNIGNTNSRYGRVKGSGRGRGTSRGKGGSRGKGSNRSKRNNKNMSRAISQMKGKSSSRKVRTLEENESSFKY